MPRFSLSPTKSDEEMLPSQEGDAGIGLGWEDEALSVQSWQKNN